MDSMVLRRRIVVAETRRWDVSEFRRSGVSELCLFTGSGMRCWIVKLRFEACRAYRVARIRLAGLLRGRLRNR